MELSLKSVGVLLKGKYSFFIPAYQRGYRWDSKQVKDLLNDIWEFHISEKDKDNQGADKHNDGFYYCLQPLVVIKKGEKYEVIDGQQRLTTLFIVLKYLGISEIWNIEYKTRPKSKEFLGKIDGADREKYEGDNIDFYYMSKAYKEVENFFNSPDKKEFEKTLKDSVKFIWYEIKQKEGNHTDEGNHTEVFLRLNKYKIPLTSAELIKALLLLNTQKDGKQEEKEKERERIKISYWLDFIEKRLQEPSFWAFIAPKDMRKDNRIEFIYELISDRKSDERNKYSVFDYFNGLINKKKTKAEKEEAIEEILSKTKSYFRIFDEWYIRGVGDNGKTDDNQNNKKRDNSDNGKTDDNKNKHKIYYHLVGFLRTSIVNYGMKDLIKEYQTENDFEQQLKKIIKNDFEQH
jgi:uncharacterized protein with ParB-like and HNH nuclease domain